MTAICDRERASVRRVRYREPTMFHLREGLMCAQMGALNLRTALLPEAGEKLTAQVGSVVKEVTGKSEWQGGHK